jgi:hypothetical protein
MEFLQIDIEEIVSLSHCDTGLKVCTGNALAQIK